MYPMNDCSSYMSAYWTCPFRGHYGGGGGGGSNACAVVKRLDKIEESLSNIQTILEEMKGEKR